MRQAGRAGEAPSAVPSDPPGRSKLPYRMKFPYSMLRDFVNTALPAEGAGGLLTMAGFELESLAIVEGEAVLDIKVMSNRGDGLSIYGLAREVLAKDSLAQGTQLYGRAAVRFAGPPIEAGAEKTVTILTDDCTRYACLLLEGVSRRESEPWMQQRLRQAGMRPISLLVDVTNYVMLEVGQPLHAFDYDKLDEGRIVVRKALPGEELTTLDGRSHPLSPSQMMICDATRAVAVAGIMGGAETEVTASTSTVLLESAHFSAGSVRRTRKQLGLSTEASYRFERSVDPDGVVAAIYRYLELVQKADPGARARWIVDCYPFKPEKRSIRLRTSRTQEMLGMEISALEAERYLSRLGFSVTAVGAHGMNVERPSWRPDIDREIDLIEELGRVHGYERIPETPLKGTTTCGGPAGFELWTDWLRTGALRAGFSQMISHTLSDRHPLDDPAAAQLGPRSPASPDMATIRNSLLPGLADAARHNNPKEASFFEIGHTFTKAGDVYVEDIRIAFICLGPLADAGWSADRGGSANFFTLKGGVEGCLGSVGVELSLRTPNQADPRLHPARQAEILVKGAEVGLIGQLHPDMADSLGLAPEAFVAEISIKSAFERRNTALGLHPVSRHPSVRRDISVLVDKSIPYAQIASKVGVAAGSVLERHWLFDVFEGQGIPAGKQALGIALQLRKADSTFTDEEANLVRDQVVQALASLGATTR